MMNCEYLVYATDGSDLSHDDLSSAYKILTTVPYPYNTNPDNAAALSQLTPEQRTLLDNNEAALVLQLLQQINPLINISYFPKSLVQFYLFAGINKIILSKQHELFIQELNRIEQDKIAKYAAELRSSSLKDIFSEEDINEMVKNHYVWGGSLVANIGTENFFKECTAANENPEIKTLWVHVNNALVKEFQHYGADRFNRDLLLQTVNSWTGEFCMEYTDNNRFIATGGRSDDYDDFMSEPENIDILRSFLTFEVNSIFDDRINHLYTVYRGSSGGPYGDINLIKREPNHTLSLSNGICEGVFHDKGANSWYFSSLTRRRDTEFRSGFAFMFDPVADRDTVLVPPLNRISGPLSAGEHFHVRTKAAKNKRNKELLESSAFVVSNQLSGEDKAYETLLKHRTGTLTAYLNSKVDNTICAPWPEYIPLPKEQTNSTAAALVGALPYAFLALFCLYVGKKSHGKCSDKISPKYKSTYKERQALIARIDMV
jgi:hypothetical protein